MNRLDEYLEAPSKVLIIQYFVGVIIMSGLRAAHLLDHNFLYLSPIKVLILTLCVIVYVILQIFALKYLLTFFRAKFLTIIGWTIAYAVPVWYLRELDDVWFWISFIPMWFMSVSYIYILAIRCHLLLI